MVIRGTRCGLRLPPLTVHLLLVVIASIYWLSSHWRLKLCELVFYSQIVQHYIDFHGVGMFYLRFLDQGKVFFFIFETILIFEIFCLGFFWSKRCTAIYFYLEAIIYCQKSQCEGIQG